MSEYICRLGTSTGEIVTRTFEAEHESDLRTRLEREGYKIFSISSSVSRGILSFGRKGTGSKKVKLESFLLFNQQLAALLRAGLPILQAISILRNRVPNEHLRQILEDVEDKIKAGLALSQAFASQGETFPRLYVASIMAGERAGQLDDVLARYVRYQKSISEARRRIIKALTYPVVLICASFVLVLVLSTYVIPKFMLLYGNVGQAELPMITQVVVGTTQLLTSNLIWIVPTLILGSIAFYLWRRTESGRLAIDSIIIRLPIAGETIKQMTLAQMTRSLSTLLSGGITLPESVEIANSTITNRALRRASDGVLLGIIEGRSFTESLEKTGWISELATDMIGVGERSGSLKEMLDEVANFYDSELDVRLGAITTLIEPVILIFMGSVVMTILLAMYLPLFNMIGNMGKTR